MIETQTLNDPKVRRMCTEKAAYITKDEAKRVRHEISKSGGMRMSVYQCPSCHCWHLTSQKENG